MHNGPKSMYKHGLTVKITIFYYVIYRNHYQSANKKTNKKLQKVLLYWCIFKTSDGGAIKSF